VSNPGRKFWLALIATVQSGLLLYFGALTATAYSAVVGTALLAYIGGNVAQRAWADRPAEPVKQG